MQIHRRVLVRGLALSPLVASAARAQEAWPTRPVRLIVPQGPGSGTDLVSRSFAELLTTHFRQPFVVDNRPGANGILGTQAARAATPDGYTLLFTYAAAQVVNQSLYPKAGYDGANDFAAIAQIGAGGNFLVVPAGHPATSLQSFIAWVKAQPPESVAYGSWGIGSGGHLSMEVIAQHANLKLRHVPYKTVAASNQDLVAGHIQAGFSATAAALPLIQSGKLRALAISGPTRSAQQPDVPTMTEQGVKFDVAAWYGVFAPRGTPRAIIEALNREINRVQGAPEHAQRWTALGFTLTSMPQRTPDDFARQVRDDIRDWGDVVRKGNIRVDD